MGHVTVRDVCQGKQIPQTQLWVEPTTCRFVIQLSNHCAIGMPILIYELGHSVGCMCVYVYVYVRACVSVKRIKFVSHTKCVKAISDFKTHL